MHWGIRFRNAHFKCIFPIWTQDVCISGESGYPLFSTFLLKFPFLTCMTPPIVCYEPGLNGICEKSCRQAFSEKWESCLVLCWPDLARPAQVLKDTLRILYGAGPRPRKKTCLVSRPAGPAKQILSCLLPASPASIETRQNTFFTKHSASRMFREGP